MCFPPHLCPCRTSRHAPGVWLLGIPTSIPHIICSATNYLANIHLMHFVPAMQPQTPPLTQSMLYQPQVKTISLNLRLHFFLLRTILLRLRDVVACFCLHELSAWSVNITIPIHTGFGSYPLDNNKDRAVVRSRGKEESRGWVGGGPRGGYPYLQAHRITQ